MSMDYDYIIVGAGSAGSVLAARLSEDAGVRVLLLEAGPSDRGWEFRMPAAMTRLLASPRYTWSYLSEPEPALGGRHLSHVRGRVIGGSSSVNGMVYMRGHAGDYDSWAEAGCRGWSYAEVLPYFRRSERHAAGADAYRGGEGPLPVSPAPRPLSPLARAFLEAGRQAGHGVTEDANGAMQEGFGPLEQTVLRGERWSAARAYLEPVAARPNLTVLTGALAVAIRLETRRAAGVDFIVRGERRQARARREVILAAGAIGSPQILQLSGIGPGTVLRRLGIEVRRDLPGVGANLSDHPDIALQHRCRRAAGIYSYTRAPRRWLVGLQWLLTRRGPAAQNHVEAGAFLRSRGGIGRPDIQLTLVPLALKPGSFESIDGPGFQIHIDLMQPRSRGSVRLSSPDPAAAPAISFNFLAAPEDLAALVAGLRLTRELLACPAFDELRGEEIAPGPALRSAAEIEDWLRQTVEIGYHTAGSCKMGPAGDPRAVVGPDLRLRGIEGLRIADASVMPATVSGNTNAPVIMIAEKASDLIRGRDPLPAAELPGPRGLAPSPA